MAFLKVQDYNRVIKTPWGEDGPLNHLRVEAGLDHLVVNEEVSLFQTSYATSRTLCARESCAYVLTTNRPDSTASLLPQ